MVFGPEGMLQNYSRSVFNSSTLPGEKVLHKKNQLQKHQKGLFFFVLGGSSQLVSG